MSDPRLKLLANTSQSWAVNTLSFVIGLVAAPLPARWREKFPLLESSRYKEASIPSALLQVLGGLGLFVLGYLAWIERQYGLIDATAEAAGNAGSADVSEQKILGRALLMGNPLMPLVFALTTPTGALVGIIACCGAVRLLHGAITRDCMPDPILGITDWVIGLAQHRARHEARERSKDRAPDRLLIGRPPDGFALCLESATDLDWQPGNTVMVGGDQYRLKARREVTLASGMRLRYELEKMPRGEVIRGLRRYEPAEPPIIVTPEERLAASAGPLQPGQSAPQA